MKCPKCSGRVNKVIDSRQRGNRRVRRRFCNQCNQSFYHHRILGQYRR